jgi:acyl-coenzyme A synthetase/AMP-(fatty) acid ligase
VIGVSDVQQGEIIVCVVVFREKLEVDHNIKEEMSTYLADKLTKYKLPQEYFVVSALPRNHLGKV